MPTPKELLESLRDEFQELEYGDDVELNRLENRGRMIIRRVSGENSNHYQQFVHTQFGIYASGISEETNRWAWQSGKYQVVNILNTMLEELELGESEQHVGSEAHAVPQSNRVFVVHGHDEGMRESVARVLTKLGLEPVILHEQTDRGRTIIEKFYEHSDVGFAVVLLSPDDTCYSDTAGAGASKPRARQNVILELGFFLGRLGRKNVVAIHKGHARDPVGLLGRFIHALRLWRGSTSSPES